MYVPRLERRVTMSRPLQRALHQVLREQVRRICVLLFADKPAWHFATVTSQGNFLANEGDFMCS